MDQRVKRIGTREEVYHGIAKITAGGMVKSDIVKVIKNNKEHYASRKISDRMKYVVKQKGGLRHRKTAKCGIHQPSKTKKNNVSFSTNKDRVEEYYCPQLDNNYNRIDIGGYRNENINKFVVEEMPNINIDDLFNTV